jgi:hypothetical protein
MSKNSDSVWSLVAGLFIGGIVGTLSTYIVVQSPHPSSEFASNVHESAVDIVDDPLGPISAVPDVTAKSAKATSSLPPPATNSVGNLAELEREFEAQLQFWSGLTGKIYGDEVFDPESPITKEAGRLLLVMEENKDATAHLPITTLVIYTLAAHNINFVPPQLASHFQEQINQVAAEAAYWQDASEKNARAAIAARNEFAHQVERAARAEDRASEASKVASYNAQVAAQAQSASQAAMAALNTPRLESPSERQERLRIRFQPPPINQGIEIHNGRAYGPDGNFMNITPQGSRVMIEP